ncbi:6902_t:CDS:1, partial [Scutellospora calospora]
SLIIIFPESALLKIAGIIQDNNDGIYGQPPQSIDVSLLIPAITPTTIKYAGTNYESLSSTDAFAVHSSTFPFRS